MRSAPRPIPLDLLFHHRWTVPVLVELHVRRGCRFAELAGRLGVSRDVLSQTLAHMVAHRLARRNPGYGHPMRPEYLPTARADRLGPWCAGYLAAARELGMEDLLLRRWPCAVLLRLARGAARFSELRAGLEGITPRALSQCLRQLEEGRLIVRTVGSERPPRVVYALGDRGRRLAVGGAKQSAR